MNELQVFNHDKFGNVRRVDVDGKPGLVASDVARALGYTNPSKAVSDHCKGVTKRYILTNGGEQLVNVIFKPDLWRLAAQSELPGAEEFESWIFDEVLVSIDKYGAYMTPDTLDKIISSPEFGIKLLTALKEEQDKNKALEAANSQLATSNTIMQPKAEYFDELVDRNLLTSFRDTAKELKIKEKLFVNFLLDHKYIFRDGKGKLTPYAGYEEKELFAVKECYSDKTGWSGQQTLITPKGRETFRLLMTSLKSA